MNGNSAIFALLLLVASTTRGASIPSAVNDETCAELCSSCDGVAEYEDGHCECSIPADSGTECLARMKRQAQEQGLDLVSCEASDEPRATRCALGTMHRYGKNDIDQVAKYFMQDGPMTGSIFVAPPYTNLPTSPVSAKSADCGSPQVGSSLITQPKEFMPEEPAKVAAPTPKLKLPGLPGLPPIKGLGLQNIAPRFLSMLGELLTRPILGLPQAIQSVSQMPGVSQLVGAPATLLNSVADEMAQNSEVAKANLDDFREVVGKAQEDAILGAKPPCPEVAEPVVTSQPTYSLSNPHPMISWLNPTVGAPAPNPVQFVGSPAPMQFVGAPAPAQMQLLGSPATMQLIQAPLMAAAQLVSSSQQAALPDQVVGASAPSSDGCGGQMVGSPSPASSSQMVGAASPVISSVPMIQSLGSIPYGSIVGQMTPTYVIASPMQYYSAVPQQQQQPAAEEIVGDARVVEEPKKICKKANRPVKKVTRDVKAAREDDEVKFVQTTTTTTELAMIDRTTTTTTGRPRDKGLLAKLKPAGSKIKAEKKL